MAVVICPIQGDTYPFALEEMISLSTTLGVAINYSESYKIRDIVPATFIKSGKIAEIKDKVSEISEEEDKLVIIDAKLSPIQQRNLEVALGCKVIDRIHVILEIFARRARSAEGRLQVDLAYCRYQRSRIVRCWTHLERQRGSLSFIGGPGESQKEMDRRMLDLRIEKALSKLEEVQRTRALHRDNRQKFPYPIVALVGYTNAGKSTLFNRLTNAEVYAEDQLFATLDTTLRHVKLPSGRDILLSDTVGFISNLPTMLIESFKSTLEEVCEADVILHVRDSSHSHGDICAESVNKILEEIFKDDKYKSRMIDVHNKCDILAGNNAFFMNKNQISALTGFGIGSLLDNIEKKLQESCLEYEISIPYTKMHIVEWLYQHGHVISSDNLEEEVLVKVMISESDYGKCSHMLKE
jgi:GTPase